MAAPEPGSRRPSVDPRPRSGRPDLEPSWVRLRSRAPVARIAPHPHGEIRNFLTHRWKPTPIHPLLPGGAQSRCEIDTAEGVPQTQRLASRGDGGTEDRAVGPGVVDRAFDREERRARRALRRSLPRAWRNGHPRRVTVRVDPSGRRIGRRAIRVGADWLGTSFARRRPRPAVGCGPGTGGRRIHAHLASPVGAEEGCALDAHGATAGRVEQSPSPRAGPFRGSGTEIRGNTAPP